METAISSTFSNKKHETHRARILVLLLVFLALAVLPAVAGAVQEKSYSDDKWGFKLTNVNTDTFDIDPWFKLDFDWKWGFIPVPKFSFGLEVDINLKGNFEVNIKKANLNANTYNLDSKVIARTAGLYKRRINEGLTNNCPRSNMSIWT